MRADQPSLTALAVALFRARMERPASPDGDPGADLALARSLASGREPGPAGEGSGRAALRAWISVRTRVIDGAVVRALASGVDQVVILGAGYDARALRFRTPGVRFLEVDHPATQADKRARLAELGRDVDDVAFVPADFTAPGLGDALAAAGHDPGRATLWVLEGVLRYLPEQWFRALPAAAADRSAAGSTRVASVPTREPDGATGRGGHEDGRLAEIGAPGLTVPPRAVALAWLEEAGWTVEEVVDAADADPDAHPGHLVVTLGRV